MGQWWNLVEQVNAHVWNSGLQKLGVHVLYTFTILVMKFKSLALYADPRVRVYFGLYTLSSPEEAILVT